MIYRLYISGLGEPANLRAELRRAASLHCMCVTSMDQTSLAFSIRMYFPASRTCLLHRSWRKRQLEPLVVPDTA